MAKNHLGIDVGWVWLVLAALIGAGGLSYFDVKVSVAVLGVALVLGVIILAIFGFGVATVSSGTNFSLESLNVLNVTMPVAEQKVGEVSIAAGAAAVGIFVAFWSWVGFEMAPNYAEESIDAKRIIPQSLYLSAIGLGVFYTLISWCAVSAFPTEADMLAKAVGDSGNFFLGPIEQFVGGWAKELMSILILTSSFACGMAFHNTAARYMYSLGREGVIPSALGKTHPQYKSPYVALIAQSVLAALWIILYAVFNGFDDPNAQAYLGVYTLLAVLGTGLLLVLQAIVSLAIINYFRNNSGGNVFTTIIAPPVSFLVQVWLVYLLVSNLASFAGTSSFANAISAIGAVVIIIDLIWGVVLKSAYPKAYANIGHMVNDG